MKVILTKSWTNAFGRKYPIGQKILCDKELGEFLIKKKYGKEYEGSASDKVKTDFFKPKEE
jgi:hypothetical protein